MIRITQEEESELRRKEAVVIERPESYRRHEKKVLSHTHLEHWLETGLGRRYSERRNNDYGTQR